MALPNRLNVYPTFETKLPSNPKIKIKYRPYTSKEEKLLLLVNSANVPIKEMVDVIKQILGNCIISPEKLDIDNLPMFDLEFLFLKLRCKSVDDIAEFDYTNTGNKIEGKCGEKCPDEFQVSVNLDDVEISFPENAIKDILLADDELGKLGIRLKYPAANILDMFSEKFEELDSDELFTETVFSCLEYFYDEKDIYKVDKNNKEEVAQAKKTISSFTSKQNQKIENFFANTPKLKKTVEVKCPKCGHITLIELEGLQDFFV